MQVKLTKTSKPEEHTLKSGEDLLVADHTVTATDRTVAGIAAGGEGSDLWTKGKFSPATFIDKDAFLKADSPDQNPEQRSAISSLRKRLK